MKCLILAAGYGTRLNSIAENKPKPLIEVDQKPIVNHILEHIRKLPKITEIFIVTNHRFFHNFKIWLNHYEYPLNITIIDDGTISPEGRLGAVGDINFVLKEKEIDEDLLVIAGDNLFGFSLNNFINFFKEVNTSIVAFRDLQDIEKVRNRLGVGVLEGKRVVNFQEKPAQPQSSLAATACYVFAKEDLKLVESLVEQGVVDNPGDLVRWLVKESFVHGFVFNEHWFDIGSPSQLEEAREHYDKNL